MYNSKKYGFSNSVLFIIPHIYSIVKEIERNKMKICAIICEYNPFHNGHSYQLREAKCRSGADAVLCIMSGNFVQRGEAAVMDKLTRAKHAVLAGADAVIELPTLFATSNAELFAKGAISILSSIPSVSTLCFGAENADAQAFLLAASSLNCEPSEVSEMLKRNVAAGMSYAKARADAWSGILPQALLNNPNNILGLEYTRAILDKNSNIEILPVQRIGSAYKDEALQENYSSATAIRASIQRGDALSDNLPDFVRSALPNALEDKLDALEKYAILSRPASEIAKTCDCTEGLENALKKAATQDASLVETLTSARYTSSRIRRIALQTLLNIQENTVRECLRSPLYLRVLAVKKERSDLLSALSESPLPLLTRARDEERLDEQAKIAYEIDLFAEKVYALLYKSNPDKNVFI